MVHVSVIVPVYKVEGFIRSCAESLMRQSIKEGIEFIFVDDCSPDCSMAVLHEVLQKYPERQPFIKIVRHEKNLGLPSARNTGLNHATGKYIFHCDSDDYLEHDALEQMLSLAEREQAEIVWCDWYLSYNQRERYMRQPAYSMADEAVRGMLHGRMKYNVWNKLVRRSLYEENNICFPDGHGMGEDMTMIRLFACAFRVACLPEALYHYVKTNSEAFTSGFSEKNLLDLRHNVDATLEFLGQKRSSTFNEDIPFFKLNVKFPFLITDNSKTYALWQKWYPEANTQILKNRDASLRSRILQYAAWKGQFWFVWLHYQLIYRLFYGFIYK